MQAGATAERSRINRMTRIPRGIPKEQEKVAIAGSEVGSFLAFQNLGTPRRFNAFPDVWGRGVKWFDPTARLVLTKDEARQRFDNGKVVGYVAHKFVFSVIKDPNGSTPSR